MFINYKDVDNELDWVDIGELGVRLHSKVIPESPNIEVIDTTNINKRKVFIDTNFTHRDMEVKLVVVEQTKEEFRAKLTMLANMLKGKFNLKFKDNPSQVYKDVHLSSEITPEVVTNNVFILSLKLTAFDPFRYATEEQVVETDGIVSSRTLAIFNEGNYVAKPIVILEGSADKVNISIGGKTLSYINLVDSAKIEIDNSQYTVINKAVGRDINALANWRDNFIELQSGNNEIKITGDNLDLKVTIKFKNTFL